MKTLCNVLIFRLMIISVKSYKCFEQLLPNNSCISCNTHISTEQYLRLKDSARAEMFYLYLGAKVITKE